MINNASKMKEHLEKTGYFRKVMATKDENDNFIFECYYDERLSSSEEDDLKGVLEEYGPSISYENDSKGDKYLRIVISYGLIDNIK